MKQQRCSYLSFAIFLVFSVGGLRGTINPQPDQGIRQIVFNTALAIDALQATSTVITQTVGTYTISSPGSYCLGGELNGQILIDSDFVTLSLCNNHVTGLSDYAVKVNGKKHVLIQDGMVGPAVFGGVAAGILSDAGSSDVQVQNVSIVNTSTGMLFESNSDVRVDACSCLNNLVGMRYHASSTMNIVDVVVQGASSTGYVLDTCSSINHINCKAMDLSGSSSITAFLGMNGSNNVFDSCLIESVNSSAVSAVDSANGFVLLGETGSTVTNCMVNGVSAPSASAYGMNLGDLQMDVLTTFTLSTSTFASVVGFSPTGTYLAVLEESPTDSGVIDIYDVSADAFVFTSSLTLTPTEITNFAWAPAGDYLAVVSNIVTGTLNTGRLSTYPVTNGIIGSLVSTVTFNAPVASLAWNYAGDYLAVGSNVGASSQPSDLSVFAVSAGVLTLNTRLNFTNDLFSQLSWSADDLLLATLDRDGSNYSVNIFQFDPALGLVSVYNEGAPFSFFSWSPLDPRLMAFSVAGGVSKVFQFRYELNNLLTPQGTDITSYVGAMGLYSGISYVAPLPRLSQFSTSWRPNGSYYAISGQSLQPLSWITIYAPQGNLSLIKYFEDAALIGPATNISWNNVGNRLAVGGPISGTLFVLKLISFDENALCSQCDISTNSVSEVHGGLAGIGVAGVSARNTITRNTAQYNDVDFGSGIGDVASGSATYPSRLANISLS